MKKYICTVCEYIYDPAQGDPESGIEPGTAFEDIPDDWTCPLCGVGKEDFEPYEGSKIKYDLHPTNRVGIHCRFCLLAFAADAGTELTEITQLYGNTFV